MPQIELGESIPKDTAHAVSVSLPTWKANVGYEEADEWVMTRMTTGYPRFFVHRSIEAFASDIVAKYGSPGQRAILYPSACIARRCADFVMARASPSAKAQVNCLDLALDMSQRESSALRNLSPVVSAVICSSDTLYGIARQYWQHTGDGCSSRRADFCHGLFKEGLLVPVNAPAHLSASLARGSETKGIKGPKRYTRYGVTYAAIVPTALQIPATTEDDCETSESLRFLEERYGRNLDLSLANKAKSAIKRRLAGAMAMDVDDAVSASPPPAMHPNTRDVRNLREDDVYLFPCGMNAVFNIHRCLLKARGDMQSINFGFPYVDTLKILQKFGPGCVFYGHGSSAELDELEARLTTGDRFLALFCEFPGNPLLACPDLSRIRSLADKFDFPVVIDETIGTIANVNVIKFADIVVSSLTKIFSGDCNVMGGAAILNPESCYYESFRNTMHTNFVDTYWPEDIVFMERNSRDYRSRIHGINQNSEAICDILIASPSVKRVYYPKHNPTRSYYDACRLPGGGYGGLLSVTFNTKSQAVAFFDTINTAKGPSLGTNFTLTSPYALLAHYHELDWASGFGVEADLVRISVGLEETHELVSTFQKALDAAESAIH